MELSISTQKLTLQKLAGQTLTVRMLTGQELTVFVTEADKNSPLLFVNPDKSLPG